MLGEELTRFSKAIVERAHPIRAHKQGGTFRNRAVYYHRAQIKHFLGVLIGSRTPYGVGLKLVTHLHRLRWCLELPESSEDES